MRQTSVLEHIRDIIILPFTVTCIIPYAIYTGAQTFIPDNLITKIFGLVFITAGLILFVYTIYLFKRLGKGTLAPWSPTQKLIIRGPYRHCRNPMITGVLSILIGEALLLQSTNILIWAGTFFLINTAYFILFEEPDLHQRFGEDYRKYKENVPRWIPRRRPYSGDN